MYSGLSTEREMYVVRRFPAIAMYDPVTVKITFDCMDGQLIRVPGLPLWDESPRPTLCVYAPTALPHSRPREVRGWGVPRTASKNCPSRCYSPTPPTPGQATRATAPVRLQAAGL